MSRIPLVVPDSVIVNFPAAPSPSEPGAIALTREIAAFLHQRQPLREVALTETPRSDGSFDSHLVFHLADGRQATVRFSRTERLPAVTIDDRGISDLPGWYRDARSEQAAAMLAWCLSHPPTPTA